MRVGHPVGCHFEDTPESRKVRGTPQDPKLLRGLQETSQSVNASLHEGGVCLVDARAVQEAELLSAAQVEVGCGEEGEHRDRRAQEDGPNAPRQLRLVALQVGEPVPGILRQHPCKEEDLDQNNAHQPPQQNLKETQLQRQREKFPEPGRMPRMREEDLIFLHGT